MSDFLSGLISVLTPVRGSGVITEETRPLESFHGVILETSGNLVIRFGDVEQIELHGEDNILPLIETEVKEGRLRIRYKLNTSISIHRNLEYVLTVKNLDWIETTSSGEIDIPSMQTPSLTLAAKGSGGVDTGKLEADELKTLQTSSGDIEIEDLQVAQLKSELTGSGNLKIQAGLVQSIDLRMTSSGSLMATGVKAAEQSGDAKIEILGSGKAEIGSLRTGQTDIRLTSSGCAEIGYLSADLIKARISGSGDMKIMAGTAGSQQLDLSSAGKFLAGDLMTGKEVPGDITIKVTGSGSAFPGEIKADHVNLQLTSSGNLLARRVECKSLQTTVKGSGNVSIEEGQAGSIDVHLTSAGKFSARQMQAAIEPGEKTVIRISGSGDARVGVIYSKAVELITESAGKISVETIQADDLKTELKGSGNIVVHGGSLKSLDIRLTSGGDFSASEMMADTATIRSSGSGDIKLSVKDRLDAIINSSGNVKYRGKPIVSYSKDGSGEISRLKS